LLTDWIRKAGVITDADDRQLGETCQQIIDDLLFMLEQSKSHNHRLTNQVHNALKKRNRQPDDDNDDEDSRLTKRREANIFAKTPSQVSTPSSVGLSLEFGRMQATADKALEPPRGQGDTEMVTERLPPRINLVRLMPPGTMTADPIVKYNNKKAERERDRQMMTMHQLDMIVPSFWEVIPHYGNYERDNTLCNMLSEQFYVSQRNNVVYHRLHHGAQVVHDDCNTPMGERGFVTQQFDKASPKGMPRMAWEVKFLIKLLHDDYCPYYDRVLAYIVRGVTENIRDHTMRFIMDPGVYDPNFMPNFTTTTDLLPRMADPGKPPGLPNLGADSALNIDEMARYVALYGRPGPNFYTGVVVDYAHRVNRRSVFGYGLSRALGPETKASLF